MSKPKLGRASKVWKLPREIRITRPHKKGQTYTANVDGVVRTWICIKEAKDSNFSILQEVKQ